MNWRGIRAVMSKDLRIVFRTKMIVLPMILLPLIMQVLFPAAFGLAAVYASESLSDDMAELEQMVNSLPPVAVRALEGLPPEALLLVVFLVYGFAPLFLIMPMMVASVVAADSFVGERERKTLEALLYTPLTDRELLVAKMLTAWLAAVVVGVLSFVLYTVVVNLVGWPVMGRIYFPNLMWLVLVFWVSPAVAGMGLGATVLISTRVNTFQEAYQIGGIVVLPIVALMLGQFAGLFTFSAGLTLMLGTVVWIIDGVLLWFGMKVFDRDALLARL